MKRKWKYIWMAMILLAIVILIILFFNKKTERFSMFGIKGMVVVSGSMEPTIKVGDIVVVKHKAKDEIRVNDIIAFKNDNIVVTHRIVDIIDDKYQTKGDNNNVVDEDLVQYDDVEGVKIFKIPVLGYVILFMRDNFIVILVLLMMLMLYLAFKKDKQLDS